MIKIILLVSAVCSDCFATAVGIGSAGIRIPFRSKLIISAVGTLFLCMSVGFGEILLRVIPENVCKVISTALLVMLGIFNLLRNYFREIVNRKSNSANTPAALYFNGAAADTDNSKSISVQEAIVLSVALSADSLVTGISAGLGRMNLPMLCIGTLVAGIISISAGWYIGRRIISSLDINTGWICGAMLIILAIVK